MSSRNCAGCRRHAKQRWLARDPSRYGDFSHDPLIDIAPRIVFELTSPGQTGFARAKFQQWAYAKVSLPHGNGQVRAAAKVNMIYQTAGTIT